MGSRGRPKQALTLTDEERETLTRWSRRPKSPHSVEAAHAQLDAAPEKGFAEVKVVRG